MSKRTEKLLATIETLKAKQAAGTITLFELNRLAYALIQIENKTASAVFDAIYKHPSPEIAAIVTLAVGNLRPTFDTWVRQLGTKKQFYCIWDGILANNRLNKSAKLAEKLLAQNAKKLDREQAAAVKAAEKAKKAEQDAAKKARQAAKHAEQDAAIKAEQEAKQAYKAKRAAAAAAIAEKRQAAKQAATAA